MPSLMATRSASARKTFVHAKCSCTCTPLGQKQFMQDNSISDLVCSMIHVLLIFFFIPLYLIGLSIVNYTTARRMCNSDSRKLGCM